MAAEVSRRDFLRRGAAVLGEGVILFSGLSWLNACAKNNRDEALTAYKRGISGSAPERVEVRKEFRASRVQGEEYLHYLVYNHRVADYLYNFLVNRARFVIRSHHVYTSRKKGEYVDLNNEFAKTATNEFLQISFEPWPKKE